MIANGQVRQKEGAADLLWYFFLALPALTIVPELLLLSDPLKCSWQDRSVMHQEDDIHVQPTDRKMLKSGPPRARRCACVLHGAASFDLKL